MAEDTPPKSHPMRRWFGRTFNYANNGISITGIVVTTVTAISILTFLAIEFIAGIHNPYTGILAFAILPGFFVLGLVLIPIGMWRRRKKLLAAGTGDEELHRFPKLDFNSPELRRTATLVLTLTIVNVVLFGFASAMAVEHMESVEFCGTTCHTVMMPEHTAYQASPHSRVSCVQCHIGPGASWFVRSKIDGLYQVWATLRDIYPRPIETPIKNLRPARETCEQCHWPEKHYGDKLRTFARFSRDEENTPSYTTMILKTGGGALDIGRHGGIHWWHIYSDNRIRYVGSEDREEIYWVELITPDGEKRVYTRDGETPDGEELPPLEELEAEARLMDCIDCHNRPTHLMEPPSHALDRVLETNPSLRALPYFKKTALESIVTDKYDTHAAGVAGVRAEVLGFYEDEYPEVWNERRQTVESGAEAAARVFARSVFPEMNTSWKTHPNHIGHEDSPGCFRCHDETLATADGEHVISMDCEQCHVFVIDGSDTPPDLAALGNGG